jgi:hypothetical protein
MDQAAEITESWLPFLSAKQKAVFDCYKRYVLCCGGRRNGKSIAVGHKVFRHLVEIPGARVALIATTIKAAKEGGAFSDLVEIIAPIWFGAQIETIDGHLVEYTSKGSNGLPGPRMDSATRTSSFKIRNIHGGESELIMFSIDNEKEVESITKSKRFSMVWLSEGSNFKSDQLFKNLVQMLRMFHIEENQHQLIVDTNPAEEGDGHWIWKLWFRDRLLESAPKEMADKISQEEWEMHRRELEVFEFQLEDNPRLSAREIAELKASNCDNQGDYDRNILGKWVKGFGLKGKVFADILQPDHFIGEEGKGIDVDENCIELITGWDMGKVNHSSHIIEPRMIEVPDPNDPKKRIHLMHYMVLDEVVTTDERISIEEFSIMVWEKMRNLEYFYQRNFKWIHWSDNTAWNYNASSADIDATIVYNATQGNVELQAANKAKDSVVNGIKIMRRLFHEHRLFVGDNCPKTQEMLKLLTQNDIDEDTYLKHPFDSLRYAIYMQERDRYFRSSMPKSVDRAIPIHA